MHMSKVRTILFVAINAGDLYRTLGKAVRVLLSNSVSQAGQGSHEGHEKLERDHLVNWQIRCEKMIEEGKERGWHGYL